SRSPIEVPPNFMTSRVVSGVVISSGWLRCIRDEGLLAARAGDHNAALLSQTAGRRQACYRGRRLDPARFRREASAVTQISDPAPAAEAAAGPSIDPADVARFSAQAAEWWDVRGPFAP